MALSFAPSHVRLRLFALAMLLASVAPWATAASDSARVISMHADKVANKHLGKAAPDKLAVVALINLEEVMPDCQQQIAKARIKSVQRSESGITTESITFSWSNTNITIPTHMGDNPVLSLDDLVDATKFIKAGNTYFIHFQTCEHTQERSLINIYAI